MGRISECAHFLFCRTRSVSPLGVNMYTRPIYHNTCHMPKTSRKSCGKCQLYSHELPNLPHSPRGPCLLSRASQGTDSQGGRPVGSSGTLAERAPHSRLSRAPRIAPVHHSPIAPAAPRPMAPGQPVSWPRDAAQGRRVRPILSPALGLQHTWPELSVGSRSMRTPTSFGKVP